VNRTPRTLDRIALAVGLAVAVCAGPATARAQTAKEIAAARRAFQEGEEAESKGELVTALARFRAAIAIKETPQIHLRIGSVQEKLGKLVDAMASYRRGLAMASSRTTVARVANEQIAALGPKIPTIKVAASAPPQGLVVTIDGARLDASSLGVARPVDPGQHRVHAEAPGRTPFDRALLLDRGESVVVLSLAPIAEKAPPEPPPSKVPGALVIAGGGAALVAGAVLIGLSVSQDGSIDALCGGPDRRTCPESKRDEIEGDVRRVNAMRFSGIGVGALGAAGAAVGTWLLVKASRPREPSSGGVRIAPTIGWGTVGVVGSF
jgi:hypothetical protein